jgi:hypothetical protein
MGSEANVDFDAATRTLAERSAFPRVSLVKPKTELVHVGLQVVWLNGALASPEYRPLCQARHAGHSSQVHARLVT